MKKYTVYLGACSVYESESIRRILEKAIETVPLKKTISGKVVLKPNLVMAHPKVATEGYTRKQVVEGVLKVILDQGRNVSAIDIVEKSGLGVTTGTMYRHAGYRELARRYPVKLRAMEEGRQTRVYPENWKVHDSVHVAKQMAERDFLIFLPKLKTNVLSHGYSGALKLNIGTIDSRERMKQHDYRLPAKIVDLLNIANPDLIVTDGIRMAYGGNQMTQHGIDFGVIAVSTNAVAHDMVCARLLGLDPMKIDHIAEAAERGYGPQNPDEIDILGDFPLSRGQSIVKTLDFGFQPVNQFQSNLHIVSGSPYCTGGCQGIFLDWLLMIQDRRKNVLKRFPKITVFIGKVESAVQDKHILLVGRCAAQSPNLKGKRVVKIHGCPPTHKWIVLTMMLRYGLLAPLVLPSLIIDGFVLYPIKKVKGWILNLGRS